MLCKLSFNSDMLSKDYLTYIIHCYEDAQKIFPYRIPANLKVSSEYQYIMLAHHDKLLNFQKFNPEGLVSAYRAKEQ